MTDYNGEYDGYSYDDFVAEIEAYRYNYLHEKSQREYWEECAKQRLKYAELAGELSSQVDLLQAQLTAIKEQLRKGGM